MSNMPSIKKVQRGIRVPLELDAAVLRGYARENDKSEVIAYLRALEEATRHVQLTADDLIKIGEKAKANMKKRKGGVQ